MIKLIDILKESQSQQYVIFCDLDGVLVDFDKGYKELTGISTKHQNAQNKEYFWKLFRDSLEKKGISEKKYWEDLEWMSDGKQLWNYISPHNPYILTAPSVNHDLPADVKYKLSHNESQQGKTQWVKRLNNMRELKFKASNFKKDLSKKGRILIDDRKPTIEGWNSKGGIGILHTSAIDTIKQLQKLGI
jgi:hypothetical protein